jgi:hypothetical protein
MKLVDKLRFFFCFLPPKKIGSAATSKIRENAVSAASLRQHSNRAEKNLCSDSVLKYFKAEAEFAD